MVGLGCGRKDDSNVAKSLDDMFVGDEHRYVAEGPVRKHAVEARTHTHVVGIEALDAHRGLCHLVDCAHLMPPVVALARGRPGECGHVVESESFPLVEIGPGRRSPLLHRRSSLPLPHSLFGNALAYKGEEKDVHSFLIPLLCQDRDFFRRGKSREVERRY